MNKEPVLSQVQGSAKLPPAERMVKWFVSGPPFLFLLVFFAIPAAIMVLASFRYTGEFGGLAPLFSADPEEVHGLTLETYGLFFGDISYAQIFAKSLLIALFTSLICLLMAYPLALLIARSPKKSRDLMVLLVVLPLASSFLIRVYAWMILLGPQAALSKFINAALSLFGVAPVHLLFSTFAVLVALVYVHLPFMILPLYANLENHDPVLLDAAQDLGANRWQRFWRVTFPLSLPGIFSGTALVFIPVLGVFAIPEILGGTDDALVGNLIKDQFLGTRDWPFGSALSILLIIAVLLITWLTARWGRRWGGHHA